MSLFSSDQTSLSLFKNQYVEVTDQGFIHSEFCDLLSNQCQLKLFDLNLHFLFNIIYIAIRDLLISSDSFEFLK